MIGLFICFQYTDGQKTSRLAHVHCAIVWSQKLAQKLKAKSTGVPNQKSKIFINQSLLIMDLRYACGSGYQIVLVGISISKDMVAHSTYSHLLISGHCKCT